MRLTIKLLGALFFLFAACDGSSGTPGQDTVTDTDDPDIADTGVDDVLDVSDGDAPVDTATDTASDTAADTAADTAVDVEDVYSCDAPDVLDPACTYPAGPYRVSAVGDTVAPCSWPGAIAGDYETHPADLNVLYCDPCVQSIFIFYAETTCPWCPSRIATYAGMRDLFETYGAKWVWILQNGNTAQAQTYYEGHGVNFGWFTDDSDNSWAANWLDDSPLARATPWVIAIDGETMQIVRDDPYSIAELVEQLATD